MNISIRDLFALAALAGGAALTSANASAGRELIISAPVQQIDRGAETITVLGQSFHAQVANLNIGEIVKVYGVLQKDGAISDAVVQGTGTYGANGDSVFLKGVVTASDPALGRVEIDGMTVDYTSQLANANFASPNVGDTIEISGSEPIAKGLLMASASGAGAYSFATTAAATSSPSNSGLVGFHSAEVIGGGTAEVIGGGTAEVIGGGSAEVLGGGLLKSEVIGGGTAGVSGGQHAR